MLVTVCGYEQNPSMGVVQSASANLNAHPQFCAGHKNAHVNLQIACPIKSNNLYQLKAYLPSFIVGIFKDITVRQ